MSISSPVKSAGARPHRRILLTQTVSAEPAEVLPAPTPSAIPEPPAPAADPASFVRVVAYLSPEEMSQLDSAWLYLRGQGIAANKADIMRAALLISVAEPDKLAAFLKPAPPAPKATTRRRTTP